MNQHLHKKCSAFPVPLTTTSFDDVLFSDNSENLHAESFSSSADDRKQQKKSLMLILLRNRKDEMRQKSDTLLNPS
jgi:hypothetical protein